MKRGRQRQRRRKGRGEEGGGEGRSGTRSLKRLTLEEKINNSAPLLLGRLMFHLMRSNPFFVSFSGFHKKICLICGYWQQRGHNTGQFYARPHQKIFKQRFKISILTQKQRSPNVDPFLSPQRQGGGHPGPTCSPWSPGLTIHPNGWTMAFAGGAKYKTLLRSSCPS